MSELDFSTIYVRKPDQIWKPDEALDLDETFEKTTWPELAQQHLSQETLDKTKFLLPWRTIQKGAHPITVLHDDPLTGTRTSGTVHARHAHYGDEVDPEWSQPFEITVIENGKTLPLMVSLAVRHRAICSDMPAHRENLRGGESAEQTMADQDTKLARLMDSMARMDVTFAQSARKWLSGLKDDDWCDKRLRVSLDHPATLATDLGSQAAKAASFVSGSDKVDILAGSSKRAMVTTNLGLLVKLELVSDKA